MGLWGLAPLWDSAGCALCRPGICLCRRRKGVGKVRNSASFKTAGASRVYVGHQKRTGGLAVVKVAKEVVRVGFLPMMLLGVNGAGVMLVAGGAGYAAVGGLLVAAIGLSFAAERFVPYREEWTEDHGDSGRDTAHALVNEGLHLVTLAFVPFLGPMLAVTDIWPRHWPFALQVVTALVVLDFGVTLCHWASHKVEGLWRFHAVHHSVERMYGFNGLMKHPVHQSLETFAGAMPLLLVGLPGDVTLAMVFCVSVQLLLQHSNVGYALGPFRYALALNQTHRFHHLRWPEVGDVNFGLVTHVWDHVLGTFSYDPNRIFSSADLGMESEPNYPRAYVPQLVRPFRVTLPAASAHEVRS